MVAEAEPVVACTLGAAELADTLRRWDRLRRQAALTPVQTADGVRVAFRDDAGVEAELRALAAIEAACCAWATWCVSREDPLLVLEIRSTGSGIPTLHALFAPAE
jgi:hypothetical protein